MPIRTMWKGVLHVGAQEIPVRMYAAAKEHTVHFRLLHRSDHEPVRQRLMNPESGEEVTKEVLRKGAELEPGLFVLLAEDELGKLEPESSRVIEVLRFVPREQLGHEWYDRPYFLGPDGSGEAYWALVRVMEESGLEGIVRWVMRKKEYVGAIFGREGYMALSTLRFAQEVVQASELSVPAQPAPDPNEVKLAEQLTAMLAKGFDPARYHDEFHERVTKLLESKSKGVPLKVEKVKPKPRPPSLADALKASLAQAKRR